MRVGPLHVWPDPASSRLMLGNAAAYQAQGALADAGGKGAGQAAHAPTPPPGDLVHLGTYMLWPGLPVSLRVSRGYEAGALRALLAPIRTQATPVQGLDYHVSLDGHQWLCHSDGPVVRYGPLPGPGPQQPPEAFNLTFELLLVLLAPLDPAAILHGAVIEWRGKTIAFMGVSGAGKTTLSGLLAEEPGAALLTDDYIILAPGSCAVYATPLAPAVKSGAWSVLAGVYPDLASAESFAKAGKPLRYALPDSPLCPGLRGTLDLIVFPQFAPRAVPQCSALTEVETLIGLVQAGAWVPPEHLSQVIARLCQTSAVALRHTPDLAQTRALLARALDQGRAHSDTAEVEGAT